MKKLLILLTVICSLSNYAQTTFELLNPYISFGTSQKMNMNGSSSGGDDSQPINHETRIGYYIAKNENIRISHAYKAQKQIGFQKWTYLSVGKRTGISRSVDLFSELEISGITRKSFTHQYNKPNDYIKYLTNPMLFGANLEVQFTPKNSRFSIAARFSFYQAEDIQKEFENFRKDGTVALYFHLFKHRDL